MTHKPRLIVFASGSAEGGGSGFEELVLNSRTGVLDAKIVTVVSNHNRGGVFERAKRLEVPFTHFPGPWTEDAYREIVNRWQAEWTALSGWIKLVQGLSPARTINIHPGPLPRFGGKGMHGDAVHQAVMDAYRHGEIIESAVTMHFVTAKYDEGPIFFRYPVAILPEDTPETLGKRVNKIEHGWQSYITDLVIRGKISWDGINLMSLQVPAEYRFTQ